MRGLNTGSYQLATAITTAKDKSKLILLFIGKVNSRYQNIGVTHIKSPRMVMLSLLSNFIVTLSPKGLIDEEVEILFTEPNRCR